MKIPDDLALELTAMHLAYGAFRTAPPDDKRIGFWEFFDRSRDAFRQGAREFDLMMEQAIAGNPLAQAPETPCPWAPRPPDPGHV